MRPLYLSLLLTFLGCDEELSPEESQAEELRLRIQAEDYRSWSRPPDYPGKTATDSPHGSQVEVFYNDVVATALQGSGLTEWPEGSIFVVDGYLEGSKTSTAAVEKFDGAWFYADFAGEEIRYAGAVPFCTGCHDQRGDHDSIQSLDLP